MRDHVDRGNIAKPSLFVWNAPAGHLAFPYLVDRKALWPTLLFIEAGGSSAVNTVTATLHVTRCDKSSTKRSTTVSRITDLCPL